MQKLTILTPLAANPKKKANAKFNIGQRVFLIEWKKGKPFIIESYVLFVGIHSVFQNDHLMYIVDRQIKEDDLKPVYANEIFATAEKALRFINKDLRKRLKQLKSLTKSSYYDEIEVNGWKF